MSQPPISFRPLLPSPDVAFWQELTRRKLDIMRLDDSAVDVSACYEAPSADGAPEKCFLLGQSFDASPRFQAGATVLKGSLKNFNTVEDFRNFMTGPARAELVAQTLQQLRAAIASGAALENPALLRPFLMITFADLKKYHYASTVSFPVLAPEAGWAFSAPSVRADEAGVTVQCLQDLAGRLRSDDPQDADLAAAGVFWLADGKWKPFSAIGAVEEDALLGFADPSSAPETPGWPLRNLLVALGKHKPGPRRILAFRDPTLHARKELTVHSRVFQVNVSAEQAEAVLSESAAAATQIAGWSKVQNVDLTTFLDKARVAADAVDLNVKLIKWRILPDLEPERMKRTKFLLLGAGTLGCSLARSLVGWGVRRMTFVDSGKVSYSNPVRQSLFTHQDAADGRPKAQAAAEAIKAIMPDAECEAVVMDIPMPGHPQSKPDVLRSNIARLRTLVQSHDVVCMLTDSRESRWLPSLMVAAAQNAAPDDTPPPLGLTVALGFDSFLVSRQTYRTAAAACYFCNDVTAPSDSLAFRTLDQQCTVTRPGLSGMAAGVAAELVASLVQHIDGFGAPGVITAASSSLLGATPHQIRGYLSEFRLAPVETEPFPRCICCSEPVMYKYISEGDTFVERIVANSAELEDVSGLKEMKEAVNEEDVVSFDDLDDLDDEEGTGDA